MKNIAIVLAGGKGSRMQSEVPKQYMQVLGKPVLYYSLKVFEESFVDEIILVTGEGYIDYCRQEIVDKYEFKKVKKIIAGGTERYHSVYRGLLAIEELEEAFTGNVFIHDGARPCIDNRTLNDCLLCVMDFHACVAAVPVKDTIKIVDQDGFSISTPDRSFLWQMQTPQTFKYNLIKNAYTCFMEDKSVTKITDDAMVVEKYTDTKIKMVKSSYFNIKMTTEDDITIIENILRNRQKIESEDDVFPVN